MKKILNQTFFKILGVFAVAALNLNANSLEFKYEGRSKDFPSYYLKNAKIEHEYNKTINKFLTSLEVIDLKNCNIQIQFTKLNGYWGSVETEKSIHGLNNKDCFYEIKIDEKLIDKIEGQLVLIHELSHVIRHQFNPQEERWLDEGLAQLIETEYIGLWPYDKQKQLLSEDKLFLSNKNEDYSPKGKGYSTSYFFLKYLYNHFGGTHLVKLLLTSSEVGWDNILTSIHKLSDLGLIRIPRTFLSKQAIWNHFSFSVLLNDQSKADYGLFLLDYKFSSLEEKNRSLFESPKKIDSSYEAEVFYLPINRLNKRNRLNIDFTKYTIYLVKVSTNFRITEVAVEKNMLDVINGYDYVVLIKKL